MPAEIVIENVAVAVLETESVTFTVKLGVPTVVGVPLNTPAGDSVSPAGADDPEAMVQVYPVPLPPVAASVCEYADFVYAMGNGEAVVMLTAGFTVMESASVPMFDA